MQVAVDDLMVQLPIERGSRRLLVGAATATAVRDADCRVAELFRHALHRRLHGGLVGAVTLDADGAHAPRDAFLDRRVGGHERFFRLELLVRMQVDVDDGDIGAQVGQTKRQRPANAPGGTCDNRDFTC